MCVFFGGETGNSWRSQEIQRHRIIHWLWRCVFFDSPSVKVLIEEVVDSGRLQSCYIGVSLNFQLLGKRPWQLNENTWNNSNSRREIFSASSRLEKYKKTKKIKKGKWKIEFASTWKCEHASWSSWLFSTHVDDRNLIDKVTPIPSSNVSIETSWWPLSSSAVIYQLIIICCSYRICDYVILCIYVYIYVL